MPNRSTQKSRGGNTGDVSSTSLLPNSLFFAGDGSSTSPFESSSSQSLENCFDEVIRLAQERRQDIWFMFGGLRVHFKLRRLVVSLETPLHSRPTKPEVSNSILNALNLLLTEYM
jgi:hypothetical protein